MNEFKDCPIYDVPIKDKSFFIEWINNLEAQEYVQGQGLLFSYSDSEDGAIETYCALGIAGIIGGIDIIEMRNYNTLDELSNDLTKTIPNILINSDNFMSLPVFLSNLNDGTTSYYKDLFKIEDKTYSLENIATFLKTNIKYV